ncbi:response regulator [Caulobacter sp. S45]|uniref:hybrid sensor histidine kinase/response regulator n=1 Tax=Caulobacter sp. S45 TaxID=1641861 RepID=UPI00131E274D|nr:response regulator [Caulobacter sp. S45]
MTQAISPGRPVRRSQPSSLRFRLTVLTVGLIAVLLAISIALIAGLLTVQRRASEKQLLATARALSTAVDGRVLAAQAMLLALATSDSLHGGDLAEFDQRARKLAAGRDQWFVLYTPDGHQLVNTAFPVGTPLINASYPALRARLDAALAQGSAVSGLHYIRRERLPLVSVERAVTDGRGRRLILTMAISPRVIEQVFTAQDLPKGWNASLVDASGLIIARNDGSDRFVGHRVTPRASQAMASAEQAVIKSTSASGRPTLLAFTRSHSTNWFLLVGLPQGEAALPPDRWVALVAGLSVALLFVGALWVVITMRQVSASLRILTDAALRVGHGQAVAEVETGMAETDAVALVLVEASTRLRLRDAQLRESAADLERRVEQRSAELEATHLQLAHAQKLEAIGRLTGGVAHDFNNLLTGVMGNLELLQRRLGDSPFQKYVINARQAAERGAKLTGQLLAFSRRQRLEPRPVDLARQLEEIQPLLLSALGSNGRLCIRAGEDPITAIVDPVQLELAVLNLVINARDAMEGGGDVTLQLSRVEVVDPPTRDEEPAPGRYALVSVSDTGSGMAPEILDHVLEPFFTTKPVGHGSGLGLSQVAGFAKQSEGGVRLSSAPGAGTTVWVYLPMTEMSAPAKVAVSAPTAGDLRQKAILVIDDDAAVRDVAASMLVDAGCRVTVAESGEEGLARVRKAGEAIDLVLVDFAMPGMNGAEVAAIIHQANPMFPIVMMTGYIDQAEIRRTWSGAVLNKPFDETHLRKMISDALS